MYYLAVNNGSEGWALNPKETFNDIEKAILDRENYGCEFKILKEIEFKLKEK